ncbi:MAG: class I SAM-dependent methyltransferase [Xanthomonadales bacterium]|nr:class I SAM-dependent methyltransferase [Xanthomonadales bacterium]
MDSYLTKELTDSKSNGYLHYHAPRYQRLLELLHRHHKPEATLLDIGRTRFTTIASRSLSTCIDNLGFEPDGKTSTGFNYQFDLNDAADESGWRRDLPQYDIVLFCEVIEHLYTSPSQVLRFIRTLLKPGGIMILQTPNAVVLHKRIVMLLGRNPYALISENTRNPAHFREYTRNELREYFRITGFDVLEQSAEAYFDYRYTDHARGSSRPHRALALLNWFYRITPASLRPGMCFVLQRPATTD